MAKLLAHWEEYVVETGTVGRTCDWETMFAPVDGFDDDRKWIQYVAKLKGKICQLDDIHEGKT